MEAGAATVAAIAAVRAAVPTYSAYLDDELLAEAVAWDEVGRLVDAHRIAVAAEVDTRSRALYGENGLAFRHGAKDAENLVADLGRVSVREAHRRLAVGSSLASRPSLSGELAPGRYPLLADAVAAGAIGLESARMLVEAVTLFRRKAKDRSDADAAEAILVEEAAAIGPDLLRLHIEAWTALLDPDGAKPSEDEQHLKRTIRLGRTREDGMTRLVGELTPEDAATVRAALAARRRNTVQVKVDAGGDGCDELGSHWVELDGERRTLRQQDYDAFFGTFGAGLRAEHAGWDGTAKLSHEVVVHADAADLADGTGSAWTDGVLARLSIPTVERLMCDGAVRFLVTGAEGEPLHLGRTSRLFSPAQRKALVARWHGCSFPRCTAPAAWTHAHHVEWWHADDGPSDVDNGVLLCSYHHHLIHAGTSPRRMVLHDRKPHLVPRSWRGPPEPHQRLRPRPVPLGRARGRRNR